MDLRQPKNVHLRCPKCGYDFSCNTNRIQADYDAAKIKYASSQAELNKLRSSGCDRKSQKYMRAVERLENARMQCAAIKKVKKSINDESELQKLLIFKNLVKKEIGQERTVKLLQEAEDELCYNDYDNAIQRFNNFNNL